MTWLLMFLSIAQPGLVMGWAIPFDTEQECARAVQEFAKRAATIETNRSMAMIQCHEVSAYQPGVIYESK